MSDAGKIADVQVASHPIMFVMIFWENGAVRTIATTNAADLVSIGVMANKNEPPEQFDLAFAGKLCDPPKSKADVVRIAMKRSEN